MNKFVLSVLGCDRPGIVAQVSSILTEHNCNIEDLTQTVLQTEFAAIFIFSTQSGNRQELTACLKSELEPQGLSIRIKTMDSGCPAFQRSDPFVVVAIGPDQTGQIAGLSRVMYDFGCNITAIKAINRSDLYPDKIVIITEMDVPLSVSVAELRLRLEQVSSSMGLECSLQHKDIFESIHRV